MQGLSVKIYNLNTNNYVYYNRTNLSKNNA